MADWEYYKTQIIYNFIYMLYLINKYKYIREKLFKNTCCSHLGHPLLIVLVLAIFRAVSYYNDWQRDYTFQFGNIYKYMAIVTKKRAIVAPSMQLLSQRRQLYDIEISMCVYARARARILHDIYIHINYTIFIKM